MERHFFFVLMMALGGFIIFQEKQSFLHAKAEKDADTFLLNGHTSILWDAASLTRVSPSGIAAFYPRMIQLKDGSLLATFATGGNVVVAKSNDGGRSWTTPEIAAAKEESVNRDNPELLQLRDGSILLCYGSRPRQNSNQSDDTVKRFDIRVKISRNQGKNWQHEKVLYEAGSSFRDGCWEPAALQLPSGEIQLFFANEGIYTQSNEQDISMLRSMDNGITWTTIPQIISFRKKSRDGMPVPIWLEKEKQVVVAIEDPGPHNFQPYTIRSGKNGMWQPSISGSGTARLYALAHPLDDSVYAGAPYLRQLSTGETILSYQSTEGRKTNRDHNAVMQMAIGSADARNFYKVPSPFVVPEGFHALWNALCVLQDDTVVALTSTNAFSGSRPEIWMIKGYVIKK